LGSGRLFSGSFRAAWECSEAVVTLVWVEQELAENSSAAYAGDTDVDAADELIYGGSARFARSATGVRIERSHTH
jgi:hypothetical protein